MNEQALLEAMRTMLKEELKAELAPINQRLDNIEMRTKALEITIENQVDKAIKTIAEGHQHILDTVAPKDELRATESHVKTLERVAKMHTKQIKELQKKIG